VIAKTILAVPSRNFRLPESVYLEKTQSREE
jgi:hypothetical protein